MLELLSTSQQPAATTVAALTGGASIMTKTVIALAAIATLVGIGTILGVELNTSNQEGLEDKISNHTEEGQEAAQNKPEKTTTIDPNWRDKIKQVLLRRGFTVEFHNESLDAVVAKLDSQVQDVKITIDKSLADYPPLVNVKLKNVDLHQIITAICLPLNIRYDIRPGMITFIPPKRWVS